MALRGAQACAYALAVGDVALNDLPQVRRVHALVIRSVEFGLVHVEPQPRPLDARPWRRRRWLGAHFGHRDHSDRFIAISEIGGS